MRYFFHIFDGSEIHPDDVGSDLPSLDCAKRMAHAVADELQKGWRVCASEFGDRCGRG
jgi:hypothetical protein